MGRQTDKRAYHSPLRERQAADTRQVILESAADLIVGEGLMDFSLREVAARAEVSERTVYNHFPSRQALLDGLNAWVSEQLQAQRLQSDPRDLADPVRRVGAIFAAFDAMGAPARALARLSAAQGLRSAGHDERTRAWRDRLADLLDPLPPEEARRCFAVLRHLMSVNTWLALREEFDLDGDEAGQAIAWALDTLLDALRAEAA